MITDLIQSLPENVREPFLVYLDSNGFLVVKFVFIVASLFLFFHIIYLIYKLGIVKDKKGFYSELLTHRAPALRKDEFVVKWKKIKARMATMQEADYKLAIIEADKLFDELLRRMAYHGKDMGERLSQITSEQLSNINAVWESHKARNFISHDTNYHINFSEAEKMIQNYENAFREFEILD